LPMDCNGSVKKINATSGTQRQLWCKSNLKKILFFHFEALILVITLSKDINSQRISM
jgi:hypothetical protein